jgi:hypothetical protein
MAVMGSKWRGLSLRMIGGATLIVSLGIASMVAIAEARLRKQVSTVHGISPQVEPGLFMRVLNFLWQKGLYGYTHVWPVSTLLYFTSYVFLGFSCWLFIGFFFLYCCLENLVRKRVSGFNPGLMLPIFSVELIFLLLGNQN